MMKRILTSLTALTVAAAFLLSASTLSAQSTKAKAKNAPFATVAVASYDDLVSQASAIGKMIGNDQVPMLIDALTAEGPVAAIKKNLDTTKPAGVVVFLVDGEPVPVIALPLNLASVVKEGGDDLPVKDNGDETYQVDDLIAKQVGDWCFAVMDESAFDLCDGFKPEQAFGAMAKRYTVSAKLSMAGIPDELKSQLCAMVEAGMNEAADEVKDTPFAALQAKNLERSQAQLKMLLYETNQILLGLRFNDKENAVEMDVAFTAKPDTQLHMILTSATPMASKTYGILSEDTAVGFWQAAKVNDEMLQYQKDQMNEMFDTLGMMKSSIMETIEKDPNKDVDDAKIVQLIADKVFAYLDKVKELSEKNISNENDGACALLLTKGAPAIVSAGVAKDAAAVDELFAGMGELAKDIVKELPAPENDKDKEIFDAVESALTTETKEIDGIKYRIASFDIAKLPEVPSEAMDAMKKIFGGTAIQAAVGTQSSDGMVYSAVSADAVKSIQDAVQRIGTQKSPEGVFGGFFVAATPILTFVDGVVDTISENDGPAVNPQAKQFITQLLAILEATPGKDRIAFTAKPVKDGMLMTLQVQEGTLKAIGTSIMMVQMMEMNSHMDATVTDAAEPAEMTEEEINQLLDAMGLEGEERESFRQELLEGQASDADEDAVDEDTVEMDENAVPAADAAPTSDMDEDAEVE